MNQPTRASCECFQDSTFHEGIKLNFIVFCPLHAQARAVREALARLCDGWALALRENGGHEEHNRQTNPDTMCLDCWQIREARAVLKAINGEPA